MKGKKPCITGLRKVVTLVLFFALAAFPLFALEGYGRLINTTVIPDFALGVFPVGVEYEFGITGLDFIPHEETKLVSTIRTELANRALIQRPVDGKIIVPSEGERLDYRAFISEGNVNLSQTFYRSPNYDNNFLTLSGGLKMHWEQAFSEFSISPSAMDSSVFENPEYFPSGVKDFPGAPDLNGNGLLVTNSLEFAVCIQDYYSTFNYEDGYKISIGMVMAPWYLMNRIPFLLNTYSDFVQFSIDGNYSWYLMHEEDAAGFTGYLSNRVQYQYLSGSAVPRHAQTMSFADNSLPFYNRILVNQFRFTFVSPSFLLDSNHASLILRWDEGLAFGMINNMMDGVLGCDHFGLIGAEIKLGIFNMFHFFCSCDYIYDNVKSAKSGFKFGAGGYFAYSF